MWTAFDYMYRDAGNFKAFGTMVLLGRLEPQDKQLVRECLSSEEFFIAEQVGIPPLYQELYQWSDGPTRDDHCWHEFVQFRELPGPPDAPAAMTTKEFVTHFASVKTWNESLSRHFWLNDHFGLRR